MFNRIIFALLLLAGSVSITYAQPSVGIKGGVNFANLAVDADQIDDNRTKLGYSFGLFYISDVNGLGLQTELLYTRKGAEYDVVNTIVEADLDYLELPVALRFKIEDIPLSFHLGGYAAYLMDVQYEYSINESKVDYDDKSGFNSFDIGLLGGVGVHFGNFSIDGRLTRGLMNVEDDEERLIDNTPFVGNDTKNFGLMLTAGLMF